MKRLCILLFSIGLLIPSYLFSQQNMAKYEIAVATNADSLTQKAAKETQYYIEKVTGYHLPITHKKTKKHQIIIGKELANLPAISQFKEDAFIIKSSPRKLIIAGNEGKSTLYAAYTFAEDYLGCLLLAPNEMYIPKKPDFIIPQIDSLYEPAFAYRRLLCPGLFNHQYSQWHKLEDLEEWGMYVHTFPELIPADKYYATHPEYFSLVNGTRVGNSQLCLSNPQLIAELKKNLSAEMQKQPDKKYWSVSQNDCYQYCECEHCKALYEKFGSVSGAYIHMANQIAEAFPDKIISTLAYQFTRSAPKNIKPLPNVNVMLCSIECNRSIPLAEDPTSKDFVKDLEDWSKLTNNIYLWDYVVQFKNMHCPFPNFHTLQPNLQFFKKNNVSMMFEQASGKIWSDMIELKQYLLAKMEWNPNINQDSITKAFIKLYYGNAAPFIQEYHNLAQNQMIADKNTHGLNIYGFPMTYTQSFLKPELIITYKSLMDEAEKAVQHDSIYLKRVQRQRLAIDFAYIDIALEGNFKSPSFFINENNNRTIDSNMMAYVKRYQSLANQYSNLINEHLFHTDSYCNHLISQLNRFSKNNLLKNAQIKLLSKPSDLYPVGKELALNDGNFGPLHFRKNWLGFFGEEFIVEIDLKKVENIKEISMNFLKDIDSWIFLPYQVNIEISSDGKTYQKLPPLTYTDNKPKNYLPLSVPYQSNLNNIPVRYIRISTQSAKACPIWHRGYGNPSWLFIDEIIVN